MRKIDRRRLRQAEAAMGQDEQKRLCEWCGYRPAEFVVTCRCGADRHGECGPCAADKIEAGYARRESPFRVRDLLAECRQCRDGVDAGETVPAMPGTRGSR